VGGTLFFRLGAILLTGFVVLQLLLWVVLQLPGRVDDRSVYGLPRPQAVAQMVRSIESAGPSGADLLAESYGGSLFSVEVRQAPPNDFREVPRSIAGVASGYRAALNDYNAVVDGGPGRLNWLFDNRARPMRFAVPLRLTVWLRDGRVLVLTGRPAPGLRAYLSQRSFIGFAGGALLIAILWLAMRQTTQPLQRLTHHVRALGADLRVADAVIEGSRETRALAMAFNDMKRQIARLVEERTFILAGIAHDMRTYLTRLRLRAEFIAEPDQRSHAEADIDQMTSLLNDSLLLASIDRVGRPLKLLDLCSLTRELAIAQSQQERLTLDLAASCWINGDPGWLARIFANLVENGLRYATHVFVSAANKDGTVEWHFEDDGPGVPAEKLCQLGQAFARVDPSRDRRTGGAGLGLAIVAELATAQGGKVLFGRSRRGGLAVMISFPLPGC
jgi:signal transduction histidine kinase